MKYDYEDYETFVKDQKLNLFDAFFDEFREFEPCEFDDFDKWLSDNKQETKFEEWAWDRFENYRQTADQTIYERED